jgi:hypothetical protein
LQKKYKTILGLSTDKIQIPAKGVFFLRGLSCFLRIAWDKQFSLFSRLHRLTQAKDSSNSVSKIADKEI